MTIYSRHLIEKKFKGQVILGQVIQGQVIYPKMHIVSMATMLPSLESEYLWRDSFLLFTAITDQRKVEKYIS